MRLPLGPSESVDEATLRAAERLFEDERVAAVLIPLWPEGESRVSRAARRYMAEWDARFIHDQTCFAPGARVAFRDDVDPLRAGAQGWRAAEAAPFLQRALDEGRRVVALREGRVATPIARDLDSWLAWAREEGAAWGRLARVDARFARFAPAHSRASWVKHNLAQASRRGGEVAQAMRRVDVEAWILHATREAAWSGAFVRVTNAGTPASEL